MRKFDDIQPLDDVAIDEKLHETTAHGDLEYPVSHYHITLSQKYMGNVRWHWHEELEISIVRSGTADFMTDDRNIRLTSGQALIFNQNILHAIHSVDGSDCVIDNLLFRPSFIFSYGHTSLAGKYLAPIVSSSSLKMILIEERDPYQAPLFHMIEEMIELNSTHPFAYELRTKSLLCNFWATLLDRTLITPFGSSSDPLIPSSDEIRIKQALLYITEHYTEPISLEDIADSIHVSKSECCRCFKRMLKLSPFEYLMKYRVYESTRKLLDKDFSEKSMSILAASVGFNNASYYNKLFKRYLNCTPTEYREQTLKASSDIAHYFS